MLFPQSKLIVPYLSRTATGNSGLIARPMGACLEFILDVTAVVGVSTLEAVIQITPDNTRFFTVGRFGSVAAIGTTLLRMHPYQAQNEAASVVTLADTGAAAAVNQILTRNIRILWTLGATPDFTFGVWMLTQPEGADSY